MFCYVSLDLNVLEFNTVPIMMSVNIHVYQVQIPVGLQIWYQFVHLQGALLIESGNMP